MQKYEVNKLVSGRSVGCRPDITLRKSGNVPWLPQRLVWTLVTGVWKLSRLAGSITHDCC